MSEKLMRLSQVARTLNVGISTIGDYLASKGMVIETSPNTKITTDQYDLLVKEFASSLKSKEEAREINISSQKGENFVLEADKKTPPKSNFEDDEVKIKNLSSQKIEEEKPTDTLERTTKLPGIKVLGKVDLTSSKKPKAKEEPTPEPQKPQPVKENKTVEQLKAEKPKVVEAKVEPTPAPAKAEPVAEVKPEPKVEEKPVVPPAEPVKEPHSEVITGKADKLQGLTVLDKIELPVERKKTGNFIKPVASSDANKKKRKRKKVGTDGKLVQPEKFDPKNKFKKPGAPGTTNPPTGKGGKELTKDEISQKQIQDKLNETLSKLSGNKGGGISRSKYRREKRSHVAQQEKERLEQVELDSKILKVTEFVSANELASLMNVSVNQVISACMNMGMFVSINQRLDAEAITIIADEFGYEVKFLTDEENEAVVEETEDEDKLVERPPIVTIMGHVDHGKTSLLDYIRNTNVTDKEAGGITQHIGAYSVKTDSGRMISFLDTPGHEAFTAMRARGAQITDIVVIVVAADDSVMPQTKEAINHAKAAGVPIIIAINKIDKQGANPEKIREQLSVENILVEDWGGKYQCQEISAKKGTGIADLLEKILLEADVLELKANPERAAVGTVVEASLDKGRGYVTTVLVQKGTLKVGDVVLAGSNFGKVKAMTNHLGIKQKEAGPSVPVQVLGLDGAPQSGDTFKVMDSEREARELASSRAQIQREQSFRTKKHITLDEIGRRLAIGNFKELNLIVKGDVDGSVEALTDSLLKLSTEKIGINVISKGVGQISESDVLLASASDAIIIGFQVRPSANAKKLAENEQIDIRLYSIIYRAIDEIKDAMEGMLEPETKEVIVGNVEIRETFKISKLGTIAGCMVVDGSIKRNNRIRIIREGIVTYEGELNSLKRFKDDVAEVKKGFDCGLGIKGFNDLLVGDIIESYEIQEVKKKL